jgi:ferric-dicitrate binding protein FerR (iron transport regulator)
MSHDPDPTVHSSPEERRAAEAVHALGEARIGAAFRERLRGSFVAGSFDAAARPPARRPTPIVPLFAFAAAASAVLLVWLGSAPPRWTFAGAAGAGELRIDGRVVDAADPGAVDAALAPGVLLVTSDSLELDLVLANRLTLEVTPGTELTLPDTPRRWFGGHASCEIVRGDARFATGREMPGRRFVVQSPLAAIEVTGTRFAVIAEPDGACVCVCVLDGSVSVTDPDGTTHAVTSGLRRTLFREADPDVGEMRPDERVKLAELADPDLN